MSYSAEISRNNPTCFLFLIDQSGSMNDLWGVEAIRKKSEILADIINRLLQELVLRCAKAEGVRDYFHIGIIGYGEQVISAFGGELADCNLVPISQIAENPASIEERVKKINDGAGGLVEQKVKFPIWVYPRASGGTPMRKVFEVAIKEIKLFLDQHPDCYPPVVIHITDGESTDGDPSDLMREIKSLSSSDGNVLLYNYHISKYTSNPIKFPHSVEQLPGDPYAKMLFECASELTDFMFEIAKSDYGMILQKGAKGYVYNADDTLIIQALDIGTRSRNLR